MEEVSDFSGWLIKRASKFMHMFRFSSVWNSNLRSSLKER